MNEPAPTFSPPTMPHDPANDPNELAFCHGQVMREILSLVDYAESMVARVGPPLGRNSRRYLESACFAMLRVCEYLAVTVVLARQWDVPGRRSLANWTPQKLLETTTLLAGHPMPFPILREGGDRELHPIAKPVSIGALVALYSQTRTLAHVAPPEGLMSGNQPSCDLDRFRAVLGSLRLLARGNAVMLPENGAAVMWHDTVKEAWVAQRPEGGSFDALPELDLDLDVAADG